MVADRVVEAPTEIGDRTLELRILERGDAATVVADDVMVMMLAAWQGGLVARRRTADVEPLDQAQALEHLQRAVDGGDADLAAAAAELVGDLAGAEHAVLTTDQLEHGAPRGARAVAGRA